MNIHIIRNHPPSRQRHNRQQAFDDRPQVILPQPIDVIVVILHICFPGGVQTGWRTAEEFCYRRSGSAGHIHHDPVIHIRQSGKRVLGVVDRIPLIDYAGAKIAFHNGLCGHDVPEPALHFRVCSAQQLIQPLRLHVVDVGPEGQRCDIGSHIVPADDLIINRFDFAFSPVDLRHLLHPGEFAPDESDDPAVVYSGHHVSGSIIPDCVIGRQTEIRI